MRAVGLEPRPLHAEEHAALQLFACVRRGDLTSVRTALKGAALTANARDEFGNTILIIAAEVSAVDMRPAGPPSTDLRDINANQVQRV